MKNYIYTLLIISSLSSCSTGNEVKNDEKMSLEIVKVNNPIIEEVSETFSVKATFSPEFGWGYQILNNGELYINQPHIPSVQGNKGFETKDKAIKTAEYILNKLKNNIFPPTVSPQELDSLGVL
jgi:hypothetical protein